MQVLHQKEPMGPMALRFGLALALLWSVITKFTQADMVAGMLKNLGFNFANETFVILLGVVLLVVSVLLILGKYLHHVGIVLTVYFLVTLLAGAVAGAEAFGSGIWKDFALLGIAMYFMFAGEGKNCCK